jgi:hypothetical protein
MATILEVKSDVSDKGDGSAISVVWTPVTEADTCRAVAMAGYSARSCHVSGTFGSATLKPSGSNTGTNFFQLTDPQGVAIALTSEGLKQVQETVTQYKPVASGGSAQSLTITMLFTRAPTPRS